MITPGQYSQKIDHYGILHTIQKIEHVKCILYSCSAPVLTGMWN